MKSDLIGVVRLQFKEGKLRSTLEYPITSIAQYPQVAEYRQLSKMLLSFEAEFGMTAASRTRIELKDAPSPSENAIDIERREFFKSGGKGRKTLAG